MTFGEKIVYLRKLKGLSQDQLAERLGVTRQSISKWERDEVIADTNRVLDLSHLFGVSCDYLLDDNITDVNYSKPVQAAPPESPAATVPPLKKVANRSYWHWFGLWPLLWGLGDLLAARYFFAVFTGIHIREIPSLIYQLLTSSPRGVLIFFILLLALLFMLAKIALGLFLIIWGCKRNAKLPQEESHK